MEISGSVSTGGGALFGWCNTSGAFGDVSTGGSGLIGSGTALAPDLSWNFYASRNWTGSTSIESTNHTHSFTTGNPSSSIYISNGAVRPLTTYSNMIIKY